MSVDLAVQELVREYLDEECYCTRGEAKDIAELVAKDVREMFESDIKEMRNEISRLTDRENRMWDILHQTPPSKFTTFKGWLRRLVPWRKN